MAIRIQLRRDTAANWTSVNPVLKAGEFGIETDTLKVKVGNGTSTWTQISSYLNITPAQLATTVTSVNAYTDTAVASLGNTAANTYVPLSDVGNIDGVASLDGTGKIPDTEIPAGITRDTELSAAISTEVTNRNLAITNAISNLIDGAPAALDTLNELAAAINDDASYAATITTALGLKAPLASPSLTGTPLAPTAAVDTNTTQIATTAFAKKEADDAEAAAATDATTKVAAEAALRVSGDAASVATAAADATTKAGAALTSANSYTDTAVSSLGNTAATTYVLLSDVGNIDGVASLDGTGKIPDTEIPAGIARDTEVTTAISTAINTLINSAPGTLDTLGEIATAMATSDSAAAALVTAVNLKAPIASPTFTGTVSGITKDMVGLANADNTTDANKPVSTATQTALDLKLNLAEPSVDYYVSNSGTGGYLVNGVLNGTINFVKGKKYRIIVNAVGHPFWIQTSYGAYNPADVYSTGVTNAGTDSGSILVELPLSAPDDLYYACQYHSTMKGTINSKPDELLDYATSSAATAYTITSANSAKTTEFTATTDVTITIPSDPSNTTWPIGTSLELRQMGVGRLIFSATSPATIVSTDGYLKTRTQYSSAFLEKRASNAWILTGDIDA